MNSCLDSWYQYIDDIVAYLLLHLFISIKLVMLCAEHNSIYADGVVVIIIFYSHLTFCIRAQIGHLLTLTAYFRQNIQQSVGQIQT